MKQSELVRELGIELYKAHTPERIVYKKDKDQFQLDIASRGFQATVLRWLIDTNVVLVNMTD